MHWSNTLKTTNISARILCLHDENTATNKRRLATRASTTQHRAPQLEEQKKERVRERQRELMHALVLYFSKIV